VETTALGAAYLAGLAVGYWRDTDEIKENWQVDNIFRPQIREDERRRRITGWNRAVGYARGWAKDEDLS
jgi:glycerol kinase